MPGVLAGHPRTCVAELSNLLTRYSISEKGKTIFNQGQPVTHLHFLCTGLVKLSAVTAEGDEIVLDVLTPCSLIGTLPTDDNATYNYTAVTLTAKTELSCLKTKDLLRLISSYPSLLTVFAYQLSTRLNQAYMMLADMKLPVGDRLIAVLARLVDLTDNKSEKTPARIPLSCREVAQLAQITPETLSRLLHPHREKGFIRVKKGLWVIKKEVLQEYVADYRES